MLSDREWIIFASTQHLKVVVVAVVVLAPRRRTGQRRETEAQAPVQIFLLPSSRIAAVYLQIETKTKKIGRALTSVVIK